MSDRPFHRCEGCDKRIDPEAPDTVAAVEMVRTVAMGPTIKCVEGMGVLFHEYCYPDGSPDYRRKRPAA